MQSRQPLQYLWLLLSLLAYVVLHYFTPRGDFVGTPAPWEALQPIGLLLLLWAVYGLYMTGTDADRDFRLGISAGLLFRVAILFCLPNLSDDFYRFVWDGRIMHAGGNPFAELPSDIIARQLQGGDAWLDLFPHLNSQDYYSVYPPVLQGVFYVATGLTGGHLLGSVILMKGSILLAEIASLFFLDKLAQSWGLSRRVVLLYALNPLIISELTGNLHFEAFMICFLLGALYFLTQNKLLYSAPLMALSVGSKLLPVLAFPFLIRRLGWKRFVVYSALSGALTIGLFAIFLDFDTLPNFMSSVRLYFQSFEFNANIYYFGRFLLGENGFWVNRLLPWIVLGLIGWFAIRDKGTDWRSFTVMLLVALGTYQLLAPVIHPWYLGPLLALCFLGPYRFPVLWGVLIVLTYSAYYQPGYAQLTWILILEYVLVFGFIWYEWRFKRSGQTLEDWVHGNRYLRGLVKATIPGRVGIKLERIAKHLQTDTKILDIGTGNGGLEKALLEKGFDMTGVDVKNISFFEEVRPVVYDGKKLPFADGEFDTSLIITVLHHTPDPEAILDEALRVTSRRLVIMEDIYRNPVQKHLTFFMDSLVNLEFEGHPHTNKDDAGWRELFARKGLRVVAAEEFRTLVLFRQVSYVVERV